MSDTPTRADDTGQRSPIGAVRDWIRGLVRARHDATLRETLEELIEEPPQADDTARVIDPHERVLIKNVLKLRDLTVGDVMVPRADIVAVEAGISYEDLIRQMAEAAHSRLPVYRETLDDAVGMVMIKDVMALNARGETFSLRKLLRKVLFVVPSMRGLDLLLQMRKARIHLALVVDEYGGIDGLVTIEDLVEEIVGEIEDEHDEVERPKLEDRPDGSILADARATIEEFEARVGPVVSEGEREDVDTLGGLVFTIAGGVPARGEVIRHESGIEFEVVDADPRRIKALIVRNLPQRPATE